MQFSFQVFITSKCAMRTCEKLNPGNPLSNEAFYVDHQHRVKSGEPCMAAYTYNLEV